MGCSGSNPSNPPEKVSEPKQFTNKKEEGSRAQNPDQERFIDFGEFSVIVREKNTTYSSMERIEQNKDTIVLRTFVGWRRGLEVEVINSGSFDNLKVSQKFENAVTINFGEQQSEHWNSFNEIDSSWTNLNLVDGYLFRLVDYDDQVWWRDRLQESFQELQAKALTYKGVFIDKDKITSASKIEELPLETWASQFIIKIDTEVKGEVVRKFIIFNQMYGS